MNNGLEELDKLMETFYELCEDCNCNEDMYQKYNLTSPHHIIRKKLERLEKLEKVVNDFLEYLSKEPNKTIPKHSIKQTFDKLLKEVFGNENS